jgi:hypothetical protein
MKLIFMTLFFSSLISAKYLPDGCPYDSVRVNTHYGFQCERINSLAPSLNQNCVSCQSHFSYPQPMINFPMNYPWMMNYQNYNPPWWGAQGRWMYPNFNYPGPWRNGGIQSQYYPGQGGVFAAKPNIYVKNNSKTEKSFEILFDLYQPETNFLATTPWLNEGKWTGVIKENNFRVDDVVYDYLFYDARMPNSKMQYEAGWCTKKDELVTTMIKELSQLGFSTSAISDFREHWDEKIPELPTYCVYPQYNNELDKAMPVSITPRFNFIRVLFIIVPHKEFKLAGEIYPSYPRKEHEKIRTEFNLDETLLMEWGVAFLDDNLIKR